LLNFVKILFLNFLFGYVRKHTFRIIIIHKPRNVQFEIYDLYSRHSIVEK